MVEPASQTRLQRLQRQRQRANQRQVRSAGASKETTPKSSPSDTNSETPSSTNTNTNTNNHAKTRNSTNIANSTLTPSSRRAASVGKQILQNSRSSSSTTMATSTSSSRVMRDAVTEEGVDAIMVAPRQHGRYGSRPPPPAAAAAAVGNNTCKNKLAKNAQGKDWFQYTNGTTQRSGTVASSSSSSSQATGGRNERQLHQHHQSQREGGNDATPAKSNGGKSKLYSSSCSIPSDEETSKDDASKESSNSAGEESPSNQQKQQQQNMNMWKEMPRVNLDQNKFKSMPSRAASSSSNSYHKKLSTIHTTPVGQGNNAQSSNNKNHDNMTPPWASRTSDKKSNARANEAEGASKRMVASSRVNTTSANKPDTKQTHLHGNNTPTRQKLLSKPVNKVGNAVELPPQSPADDTVNTTRKKKNGNRSISIRHGGTPVWLHASILPKEEPNNYTHQGNHNDDEWEWVRGYLHSSGEMEYSIEVTVDDPNSSMNFNTYSVSKRYNDGTHILMGNSWWSSNNQPLVSPSPTSISQTPLDTDRGMKPPGDLVEMTHLHEPAIVHALQSRYHRDEIYTNTGAILLALNPFKKLDHLYTREMMELYWNTNRGGDDEGGAGSRGGGENGREQRPPHAYAVAERAYSSMLRSLEERHDTTTIAKGSVANNDLGSSACNQSILVSGESGAGKTVTTKIIMRYLSILSQRHSSLENDFSNNGGGGGASVEMQVLQSNPVLESFGNARTIRNDNSSRFGKFIEMSFCADLRSGGDDGRGGQRQQQRGSLLGATIDFYLLEKVRLVSVNPGERNYHIFYELLSPRGMSIKDKKRYMLTSNFGKGNAQLSVNDFSMTSISGTFDRRDGVDDSDTYGELRTAMDTVGFSFEEQDGIFSVVSALLHASNLTFSDNGDDCDVYDQDGTSDAVSSLLGVSEDSLKMALTTSILEARGEILMKRLSMSQAEKALEATVKATYGALFAYIVTRINRSIEVQGGHESENCVNVRRSKDVVATIGVLDIFGFESFENNSFEQLCINYCNEALQQQFNRFVFKAEQAEYEYEGIEWSNIEFQDNQDVLDLIDMKRLGIFSVLDEQCRLPRRTDQTFAKSVYDTCESNGNFSASRMQQSKGRFAIMHYAGQVEYDSDSFILKNKDELPKSASDLLASSTVPLISELAHILIDNDASSPTSSGDRGHAPMKRSSSTLARATVSGQFASQLKGLRSRIATTEPHYIRCLKPNDRLVANHFDESLIAHQLNCAGVLPAMKIARAGFAMRYLHTAFIQRYRPIVYRELSRRIGGHQLTCQFLISLFSERLEREMKQRSQPNTKMDDVTDVVSWGVQVGKSKVFLRTTAFEALEELRNSTMNRAAITLQARARAFLCQNKFYLILGSVLTLQCAARKLIASLYVRRLRFEERSITIQKLWRSYYAWYHYQNTIYLTTWCQRFWRGKKVREKFIRIKQYRSAIVIQSAWRSHVFQQCHRQLKDAAIMIQCFYRVCVSTQILKQLKREAKDVQSIAIERDKLRREMRQMKRQLEEVRRNRHKDNSSLQQSDSWTTAKTSASQEEKIKTLSQECDKKDQELQMLRQEVESLRGSGRSVPSTLPLTVTVDTVSPSSKHARYSPGDLLLLPSGESSLTKSVVGLLPTSPSLLDKYSEVEDLPQLECSQISLPDSSVDNIDEQVNLSALNQTTESSIIDCIKIDELPFHQAVQSDDKEMLLEELQNSSDLELGVNSADSKGRTPLHITVLCSNLEFGKILLSHDAVANTQDFSGNTALHYADSPEMTQILLEGGISPNIPNGDGLCSLHLAVKRRDFISVKHLLLHGADVNNADDQYWYTSLHLVAHAESSLVHTSRSLRGPIAELLCEAKVPSTPDLNYQDRDGNSPLHHAASLVEEDAGILISLFIEHGACPNTANNRGQTPIHLFCHNHGARQFVFYHEALHLMLAKGADPNKTSLSGCTALHLALYHQDVEAAALLVRHGAQVNMKWKKPQKWEISWTDMGADDVLPLDMLEDIRSLHTVLAEISTPQIPAPRRQRCMHCKVKFGMFARHYNCTHCGRSVCGKCCVGSLRGSYFPSLRNGEGGTNGLFKVCSLCEPILLSKMSGVPTTIVSAGGCDQSSLGTISM